MMENNYPFILNTIKSNNEESSESSIEKRKKFKIQAFNKFKPKQNIDKEKELEGAESKVISLLSDYLKNMELESKNRIPKNLNFPKNSNLINTRKQKKRNTIISNINLKKKIPSKMENDNLRKSFHSNMNNNNNVNKKKYPTIIISTKDKLEIKKGKNSSESLFGNNIFNKKSQKIRGKNNDNNKISNKTIKSNSFYKKGKSGDLNPINMTLSKDILNKSDDTNVNYISNIKAQRNDKIDFSKFFPKQDNKTRNNINIFNEALPNSMISEGSNYNLNQKSFDVQYVEKKELKNSSNICLNDIGIKLGSPNNKNSILINKKNSTQLSQINYNKMINQKKSLKFKNKIINNKKELIKNDENYKILNNKFLKNNADYKSLKEKFKESIILRPEDLQSPHKKNFIKKKSLHKKEILNQTVIKNMNLKNIDKTINTINMGYINKKEINKKYNSSINQNNLIISLISDKKKEQNKKIINKEDESEQSLKASNTNKTNNAELIKSFKYFTNNKIERKSTIYFEKFRKLYYKPNIFDSLDDEELEDQDDGRIIYIDPNSKFALFFDGILYLSSIIAFIEIPLYLAITHDFCKHKNFSINNCVHIMIELLNILDLFLGFFRAYYNWEEQLICRHRSIIKKYLTGWFIFDLISAVPFFIISKLNESYCNEYELTTKYYNIILNKIHYILMSNKILKLVKVHIDNRAIKAISIKINDNYKFLFYIFLSICAFNYTACLYIFIARNSYPNWILKVGLGTKTFPHIYICSIYVIIMALTTVGYGDITCYSFDERIYQLFLLIVGIMAYSYAVSAVSNYIQKINEKYADFNKKKSILNEIRLNHPNLPADLYERILRHLLYKNKHEKQLKSLLFDCLPVSLKNDLIFEMYKPIINNFIFFKNFQNADFTARVILAFKPIIAYKNDILVNEGDMVEEIMFVKEGVLSIELPINMTNPQKNIEKYKNMPLLKIQNNPNKLKSLSEKDIINNNISHLNKNENSPKKLFNTTISNINSTKLFSTNIKLNTIKKEKNIEPEVIRYVKILGIRKNEHFGDVLMFLEKRSPLRLRVSSKKCELFFLKKIDAIKISNSHPTIWRNINKKSIFNFEQIKKCILKIVEIYCSIKGNKSQDNKNTDNSYDKLKKNGKMYHEKILTKNKGSKSLILSKKKSSENILDKNIEDFKIKYNYYSEIKNDNKLKKENFYGNKILNLNSSSSFSSSSYSKSQQNENIENKKSFRYGKKLMDIYNSNYKYYKEKNNIIPWGSKKTIITEKTENEDIPMTKNKESINSIKNKKQLDSIQNLNHNKTEINKNKNNFLKISSSSSKTIKIDGSYSYHHFFQKENSEITDNDNESESNTISSDNFVNKEINSGEEIKMNKDNNSLFSKKYNIIKSKNEKEDLLIKNMNFKNNKVKLLLNSFEKENNNNHNIYLNNISNINNISHTIYNNNIYLSNNQNEQKELNTKIFKNNILSKDNNISLYYESSYENCNLITKAKLIKDKSLQEKLKKYLLNKILNLTRNNSNKFKNFNNFFESNSKETSHTKFQSSMIQKEKEKLKNTKTLSRNNSPNKIMAKKILRNSVNAINIKFETPTSRKKNVLLRTSSFNENNIQKNQKNKIQFKFDINNGVNLKRMNSNMKLMSVKNIFNPISPLGNFSNEIIHKKILRKKSSKLLSSNSKTKRKKDSSLLSQIDFNIEKTNQNLNNPDEFYNNYFNHLLEENYKGKDKNIHYSGFFGHPKNDDIETKKEKLKRKNTSKK